MKIIRVLFSISMMLFFFLLGVSFADKAYLSKSVIGVCIVTDDMDRAASVCDFIEKRSYSDINDLYQQILSTGIDADIFIKKRFFNENICLMGHFPDAVYDTLVIDLADNGREEYLYLKQIASARNLMFNTDMPFAELLQVGYRAFLSFIGKTEKYIIDVLQVF